MIFSRAKVVPVQNICPVEPLIATQAESHTLVKSPSSHHCSPFCFDIHVLTVRCDCQGQFIDGL